MSKHQQTNDYVPRRPGHGRTLGIVLSIVQLILSVLCTIFLLILSIFPLPALIATLLGLFLCWLIPFLHQMRTATRGVTGKVIIVLFSIFLAVVLYFLIQGAGAIRNVSGPGITTNQIVVAVRYDDPAETLQEAINYTFGVQFSIGAETTHAAIAAINERLDREIHIVEREDLFEQFAALQAEEVDAIIYHFSLYEIMEEALPGFGAGTRILYTFDLIHILEADEISEEVSTEEVFAVLITGIDATGAISNLGRSDTNILLVVNPNTQQILMINTPRDFFVSFPSITGNRRDKLAHAGIYGPAASVEAHALLYDVDIPFYLRMNMTSFVNIIDALGGVELYSPYAFTTVHGGTQVQRGQNHFSGPEALNFVRERTNVPGGDEGRGNNAMILISAIMRRAMSPAFLTGAPAMLTSLGNDFDTNMPAGQIQDLIRFQLGGANWEIINMSATGTHDRQVTFSIPGLSVFVMEPCPDSIAEIRNQIARMQQNLPLTYTETSPGS